MDHLTSGLSGTTYRVGPALAGLGEGMYRGYADGQEVTLRVAETGSPAAAAMRVEAAQLIKLRHPRIVALHDRGRTKQHFFLVLDGPAERPLAELLSQSDLAPTAALELALQLLEALEALHTAGLAWGWMRPRAFWIDRSGRLKLFDLRGADNPELNAPLTQAEATYLAPEMSSGERPTPATDLYSWGVIAFELLAGRPPFLGSSAAELAVKHLSETPPSLASLRPELPADLTALVQRCLNKAPAERPDAAAELRTQLVAIHERMLAEEHAKLITCSRCQGRVPPGERCPLCNALLAAPNAPTPRRRKKLLPIMAIAGSVLVLMIALLGTASGNDQQAGAQPTAAAKPTAVEPTAVPQPTAVPTPLPTAAAQPAPRGALTQPPNDVDDPNIDLIQTLAGFDKSDIVAELAVTGKIARQPNEATYQVFIDTDSSADTGDRTTPWGTMGADFTVLYRSGDEEGMVLRWRDGAWQGIGAAQVETSGARLKLRFPAEWLGNPQSLRYGVLTMNPGRNLADYGPARGQSPAEVTKD